MARVWPSWPSSLKRSSTFISRLWTRRGPPEAIRVRPIRREISVRRLMAARISASSLSISLRSLSISASDCGSDESDTAVFASWPEDCTASDPAGWAASDTAGCVASDTAGCAASDPAVVAGVLIIISSCQNVDRHARVARYRPFLHRETDLAGSIVPPAVRAQPPDAGYRSPTNRQHGRVLAEPTRVGQSATGPEQCKTFLFSNMRKQRP